MPRSLRAKGGNENADDKTLSEPVVGSVVPALAKSRGRGPEIRFRREIKTKKGSATRLQTESTIVHEAVHGYEELERPKKPRSDREGLFRMHHSMKIRETLRRLCLLPL